MQITNQFTIGVHIICAVAYFQQRQEVTSSLLSASTGANPVTVRTVVSQLREADLLDISQGKTGIGLKRPLDTISFLDVCRALDCLDDDGLFRFHDKPNQECPVGKNIHAAMDEKLEDIQNAMETAMSAVKIGDVYDDIVKRLPSI